MPILLPLSPESIERLTALWEKHLPNSPLVTGHCADKTFMCHPGQFCACICDGCMAAIDDDDLEAKAERMKEHAKHGRVHPDCTPNLTDCPCMGRLLQKECAEAGCGYCELAENPPGPLDPETRAFLGDELSDSIDGVKP